MSKNQDTSIGNTDDSKRGRGNNGDRYQMIGQKIPKGVRDQIEKGKK